MSFSIRRLNRTHLDAYITIRLEALRNHPEAEQNLAQLGYQALIGRDILDLCLFVANGPGRSFILGY